VLEHEVLLAGLVLDAIADAGVERDDIGAMAFAMPALHAAKILRNLHGSLPAPARRPRCWAMA
jgi:hypothetical protein